MPVITVSGFHGVGKSVLAKHLAKVFNLRYVSAGTIFREEAVKHSMTIEEFSRYAAENPEIDRLIDKRTVEIAKQGNVVIDALLAGRMAREYADVKIWLYAPLETRVRRIAERENRPYEEALYETLVREALERERFFKYYGINIDDLRIYDVVLNTEKLTLEELLEIGTYVVKHLLKRKNYDFSRWRMLMIEVGRIVVKTAGRDAGRFGVVVKVLEDGVEITGPKKLTGVRRRKVNFSHIEPTPYKIDIPEGADDDTVLKAIEEAGLKEFMLKRL